MLARRRREREQRVAVIRRRGRNELLLRRLPQLGLVLPRELERRFDRVRSARERIHFVEISRSELHELCGELFDGRVRERHPAHVRELPGLCGHRVGDLGYSVDQVAHERTATRVEVRGARVIVDPRACAVRDARVFPAELAEEDGRLGIVGQPSAPLRTAASVPAMRVTRATTTALAIWAVTIVAVFKRSGMTSMAMRMATPSTGIPSSENTGAMRNSEPLGTGGTLRLRSTESTVSVAICAASSWTP